MAIKMLSRSYAKYKTGVFWKRPCDIYMFC